MPWTDAMPNPSTPEGWTTIAVMAWLMEEHERLEWEEERREAEEDYWRRHDVLSDLANDRTRTW